MYQVLARKYRPRNFSELVGQSHVARALENALTRGRLHHAYLFSGTRGVGKTTIARILAKCLNCETGVTATPCELCSVCVAVNEGRFIDLIEIDAASRTRVEDTRELLENVPYAPTQGRYKVYLIDEVHMLSTHSFNALLKTLEEPPEHVKFLFATTDPQKLPITIISRCLQFILRPLSQDEIFRHLQHVLQQEHIEFEPDALWQLAESAQGSLRDSLSLTDQAIAYGQGRIGTTDVFEMLGLVDKRIVVDLLIAIHQQQRNQVGQLLLRMRQQAVDVAHILEQLISVLHAVAVVQCLGNNAQKHHSNEQQQYLLLAQAIDAQDIQLYYQIAIQGKADLMLALTPEQGFEMCVLRLLAFRPLMDGQVSVTPVDSAYEPSKNITAPSLVQTPLLDNRKFDNRVEEPEPDNDSPVIQNNISQPIARDENARDVDKSAIIEATKAEHAINADADPRLLLNPETQVLSGKWTAGKWDVWLRQSDLSTVAKGILQHTLMQGKIAGESRLQVTHEQQKLVQRYLSALKDELKTLNSHITLDVDYVEQLHDSPIQLQQQREQTAMAAARQQILSHPVVSELQQQFDAQLLEFEFKPLD